MTRDPSGERGRKPGARTRGRELALKYLFAVDLAGSDMVEDFDSVALTQREQGEAVPFARHLVEGTLKHLPEIDDLLRRQASNWALDRMAAVDRNILRVACYELLHEDRIPPKVTINEAVELAKRFSTSQSGAFVNGILDQIHKVLKQSGKED